MLLILIKQKKRFSAQILFFLSLHGLFQRRCVLLCVSCKWHKLSCVRGLLKWPIKSKIILLVLLNVHSVFFLIKVLHIKKLVVKICLKRTKTHLNVAVLFYMEQVPLWGLPCWGHMTNWILLDLFPIDRQNPQKKMKNGIAVSKYLCNINGFGIFPDIWRVLIFIWGYFVCNTLCLLVQTGGWCFPHI